MLSEKQTTRISKLLSLVLRHKPETVGLTLDSNGRADVKELLEKITQSGTHLTMDILEHIVVTNNKKRFAFSGDKKKIRASQGHSINVELNLNPAQPPEYLYHGTGEKYVASILEKGLQKISRQYVHLSSDKETALAVGRRHGKPKVFIVEAAQMKAEGFSFFLSENLVWLTDHVPARFLKLTGSNSKE